MSGALKRRLKGRAPPPGWERVEEAIEDFEQQMKEAVAEEHEGKRKAELTWKMHRINWEKNRFIYDLMYVRKAISRELFEYMVREKIADGPLIAKWRKPGYEILCSMLAIQKGNHNFGTTSHCRVPLKQRAGQQRITPDIQSGCVSCASGDGRFGGPIWWNTPVEEEQGEEEEHRTQWEQEGHAAPAVAAAAAGPSNAAASKKRERQAEEEELPEDVQARLKALRGGGLD